MSDEAEEAGPEAGEMSEAELALLLSVLLCEWASEDDAAAYDGL